MSTFDQTVLLYGQDTGALIAMNSESVFFFRSDCVRTRNVYTSGVLYYCWAVPHNELKIHGLFTYRKSVNVS